MDNKTFLNISESECLIVYKEILKNSDMLWESGKILANSGNYGQGISSSIISIEELIKTIIVLFDAKGFELRKIKGISSFFRSHEIRYVVAYSMFAICLFGEDLLKALKRMKKEPAWMLKLNEERKNDKDFFEKRLRFYVLRKFITLRRELNWFSKVDLFRQEGFYCDYKSTLKTPIQISETDFTEVIKRLEKVKSVGKGLIQALESDDEEYLKRFSDFIIDFKKNQYADKIANALAVIRKTRKPPFELLKEMFDDI